MNEVRLSVKEIKIKMVQFFCVSELEVQSMSNKEVFNFFDTVDFYVKEYDEFNFYCERCKKQKNFESFAFEYDTDCFDSACKTCGKHILISECFFDELYEDRMLLSEKIEFIREDKYDK